MNKTLITGHRGLLGSALSAKIVAKNFPGKISDFLIFSQFLQDNKIETVIHCAAKVGGVKHNYENKIKFYLHNSKLNDIVFESCYCNQVKNLVNFSSTCVFPSDATYPLTEDQIFNGKPHYTNDAYAYSKRMMHFMCGLARQQGLNYFTIIPTNLFGPQDNYNIADGHVLPALIHKCYLAKQNNDVFVVGGTGKPLREFLYSMDLARITDELIKLGFDGESIIVSNSEEISIAECAKLVSKYIGFEGKIEFDPNFPDGQLRKPTNNDLLKSILPNFKFTPFEEALKDSVDWFVKNYETARK
jgi:GDP-L-fucose synthase